MLPQLVCLTQAAKNLGVPYTTHDPNKNLIRLKVGGTWYLFQKNYTPFNTETEANICLDKEHTYHLLHEAVRMPKTLGFFDAQQAAKYPNYAGHQSVAAMVADAETALSYPMVIKRNRGALANQVYLVEHRQQATEALTAIFNHQHKGYDYVALAQEYVPAHKEYRVVFFRQKPLLAYERFAGEVAFKAGYWNLPEGSSIHVEDPELLQAMSRFLEPMFAVFPLDWVGVDLIVDQAGDFTLIELNSGPRFTHFIQYNGEELVVKLYEEVLKALQEG